MILSSILQKKFIIICESITFDLKKIHYLSMNEDFLQYVWKHKLIDVLSLKTKDGDTVEIISNGTQNPHSGPDFSNAQIRIGTTLWAGNIEVHLKASDWNKHKHQTDKNYNNVILHVVLEDDMEVRNELGAKIPSVELKYSILPQVLSNYQLLKESKSSIPCGKQLNETPSLVFSMWLERLVVERLQDKTLLIKETLIKTNNNWEETFFRHLAANFGFKVNADPFFQLANSISFSLLSKYSNNQVSMEALLFGQSGLLEKGFQDKYLSDLQNEYAFLKHKHSLQPIRVQLWKFMRLRPANFPSLRLSQFSALFQKNVRLFSTLLECKKVAEIYDLLSVSASDYWKNHYVPDKSSTKAVKKLGKVAINNIIINTVAPFLFLYGKEKGEQQYCGKALEFLSEIEAEKNTVVEKFTSNGLSIHTASQSQALIQLYNNYCSFKRCYACSVGNHILLKNNVTQQFFELFHLLCVIKTLNIA